MVRPGQEQEEALEITSTYQVHEISSPRTERNLRNEIVVSGEALYGFLRDLEAIRQRQGAHEEAVFSEDYDLQMETVGSGFTEVGAILLGRISKSKRIDAAEIEVSGYRMLKGSGEKINAIAVSSFDISEAKRHGDVCGWIHSQPGKTSPSTGRDSPSDVNVSRMIARHADCPVHLALITDRYGGKITGYLYDDHTRQFRKLRGLQIKIPSTITAEKRARLAQLQYTATYT